MMRQPLGLLLSLRLRTGWQIFTGPLQQPLSQQPHLLPPGQSLLSLHLPPGQSGPPRLPGPTLPLVPLVWCPPVHPELGQLRLWTKGKPWGLEILF